MTLLFNDNSISLFQTNYLKDYKTYIFADDNLDTVMELLTESQWDDSVDTLRPIRNKICELSGVPAPTVLKKNVE